MSTSINWTELIKDRKGVITKDNQSCGNIIGEDDENIIIEDGAVRQHFYRVPKSAAGAYNGAELTLNISYDELKTYEDKDEGKGIVESIKDKTRSVKGKTVDKVDDDDDDDYDDDDEDKDEGKGIVESIKDKTRSIKQKTIGKVDGDDDDDYDDDEEHITEKRFDQDTQTSTDTNNLYRGNQEKELNRNIDRGEKSDESSTNVGSSFTCDKCNTKFTSRQELKEHFSSQH
ncbi:MAG TPA: hypothetical protein VIZ62_13135 [Nitrososphaeraceae archaeon]